MPDKAQSRRALIGAVAALAAAAALRAIAGASAGEAHAIVQPAEGTPRAFMDRALAMRRLAVETGDQPYGAVVVLGGVIVGEAPSRVVVAGDPAAHAERQAIRDALRRIGVASLAGATLYSSSRPCAICESAAARAGIAAMIHGEALIDAGRPMDR